jgi:ABC-type Co2+ transport system permease subunit
MEEREKEERILIPFFAPAAALPCCCCSFPLLIGIALAVAYCFCVYQGAMTVVASLPASFFQSLYFSFGGATDLIIKHFSPFVSYPSLHGMHSRVASQDRDRESSFHQTNSSWFVICFANTFLDIFFFSLLASFISLVLAPSSFTFIVIERHQLHAGESRRLFRQDLLKQERL